MIGIQFHYDVYSQLHRGSIQRQTGRRERICKAARIGIALTVEEFRCDVYLMIRSLTIIVKLDQVKAAT